jgi:hypothetical protein
MISPTHKRAEGRAPEWGSELTTKVATLQGDSSEITPTLNGKSWDPVVTTGCGAWRATPFLVYSFFWIYLNLREQFRI